MQGLDWTEADEVFFDEASKRVVDQEDIKSEEDDDNGGAVELGPESATSKVEAGTEEEDVAADKAERGHEQRLPFLPGADARNSAGRHRRGARGQHVRTTGWSTDSQADEEVVQQTAQDNAGGDP